MSGLTAFREAFLTSDTFDEASFNEFTARRLRYAVLWAYYENSAYRNIHTWAIKYKADYGLYRYIRNIYNPSFRLGDFWQTHLMGGALDPAAGDGKREPTALPILTDNPALRPALAQLWLNSNWQVNKDILTLKGSVLGDIALQPVDDIARQKVYLRIVHPAIIKDLTLDEFGNVKGYVFEEARADPRGAARKVIYGETATRDGDNVTFVTTLDGQPYAWNGKAAEWSEPYGFVPLIVIKHNDVGLDWGWAESYPGLPKIRELDDLASKLSDQIRKKVDSPWLFIGMEKPANEPKVQQSLRRVTNPEPGREELPALYASNPNAKAQPLVADLDIQYVLECIKQMMSDLERDYPELQMDIWNVSGDRSGRALRVARQRTESKVLKRRPNYDNGLVRAQQMALAIGGFRGYSGYAGFDLDSYGAGKLNHSIGGRRVFAQDPLDDIETDQQFWTAVGAALKAGSQDGVTLSSFLRLKGWSEDQIDLITGKQQPSRAGGQATGANGAP